MGTTGNPFTDSRVGIDRNTGRLIKGWQHCLQSIYVILTTRINLRTMRLDFGSDCPALLDQPGNKTSIAKWYVAIFKAMKWEPGFKITKLQLVKAAKTGGYTFSLTGIFYPRGHLGDYSISEPQTAVVTLSP